MGTLFQVDGATGAVNFRQSGTSNLVLETGASLPGTGVEGKIFWKSDVDTLFVHNGTDFQGIGAGYNRVYTEAPAGAIDGVNAVYTTAFSYVAGTTTVTRDGLTMLRGGVDYTETSPAAGTITFAVAPAVSSVITVSYSRIEAAMLPSMQKESMVTGTPSGNYTGSTTVFNLAFAYTVGNNALLVYSSGVLMRPGAGNDYIETSSSVITFNSARTGGEIIQFIKLGYNDPVGGGWTDSGTVLFPTTATDQVQIGLGTVGAPGLAFIGDSNTGIWSNTSDTLNIATGGVNRWQVDGGGTLNAAGSSRFMTSDGTAALPSISFGSDQDTGIYRFGANNIGFTANTSTILRINGTGIEMSTGQIQGTFGSAAVPSFSFVTDTTTGFFRQASGRTAYTSNNFETLRFGPATAADAVVHTPLLMIAGGGSCTSGLSMQTTIGVTNTGAYIGGVSAGLILVTGNDGTNYFVDLVLTSYNSGTALTIAQLTHQGTPASRTYTSDATGFKLTMGSGTYETVVTQIDSSFR